MQGNIHTGPVGFVLEEDQDVLEVIVFNYYADEEDIPEGYEEYCFLM